VYYFGCVGQAGHYMHDVNMRHDWKFMESNPWYPHLDGAFKGLQHKEGWTALAMHDFTVDSRPGSNSIFLAEGTFTREEMIVIAYNNFPTIAKRVGLK